MPSRPQQQGSAEQAEQYNGKVGMVYIWVSPDQQNPTILDPSTPTWASSSSAKGQQGSKRQEQLHCWLCRQQDSILDQ